MATASSGGVFVRRSEFDDHAAVLSLIGDESHILNKRFGRFDVTHMIENATLGITAVDGEGRVIGFAAFFDFPALTPAVDPTTWPVWVSDVYGHPEFMVHNTLWLAFFIADHLYEAEVSENILRTAFTTLPETDVFLLALPPDQRLFAPLRQSFEHVPPLEGAPDQPCRVHACPRGLYIPNLHVRTARVEDHDDLVPVFNSQSEVLSERYGEFFLAEVIGAQDKRSRALVAEADGHAVGLMALTADIDVRMLEAYFELEAFDGLMRPDPDTTPRPPAPTPSAAPAAGAAAEATATGAPAEEAARALDEPEAAAAPATVDAQLAEAVHTAAVDAAEGGGEEGGEADGAAGADAEAEVEAVHARKPEAEAEADAAGVSGAGAATAIPDRTGWVPNAFCITLFCMDESFESRAPDFLRSAFALFPGLDYCVITLPHVTPEFQLLYSFTMVEPRADTAGTGGGGAAAMNTAAGDASGIPPFGHVLYVFHRAALAGGLEVRRARLEDVAAVAALCEGIPAASTIAEAVRATDAADRRVGGAAEKVPAVVAYVVECQAQAVGVATMRETDVDVARFKLHFQLEDYVLFAEHGADGHGEVVHCVLNPIFAHQARFVLKELFRQARKSVLYFQLCHDEPVPAIAREFVQVRPRRQIAMPAHLRAESAEAAHLRGGSDRPPAGSLHFLSRKLISEPKIQNNVRIVVVGASDTSLGFLETLLTVPYLHFTSVTLIDRDGLPDGARTPSHRRPSRATGAGPGQGPDAAQEDEAAAAPDAFCSSSFCFSSLELRQLALGTRVRTVRDDVADVDREAKAVELASGGRVAYDLLLLAPALHDQTLAGLGEVARAVGGAFSVSGGKVSRDVDDYLQSTAWARRSHLEDAGAFVFGGTLSAYCSLQALLARDVPADRLCLLVPPRSPSPFADPRVEERIRDTLDRLGIAVLEGQQLVDVRPAADGSIGSVILGDAALGLEREVPCSLLLTADVPDVDDAIFRACNANSLVYDGRLVIDAAFRTSDLSIYAAGPLTKFSRRYRGGINLEHYDKRDVGVKVAHSLLPLLDPLSATSAASAGSGASGAGPLAASAATASSLGVSDGAGSARGAATDVKAADTLPTFSQPRAEGGVLPGGHLYLHIARPAKPVPYAERVQLPKFGRELVTDANGSYCCCMIDTYDTIDSVTYLGPQGLELGNVKQLIGLPQMYLNRLVPRFDDGLIEDLPTFLRENWAMALFHDRFGDFRQALKGELLEEEAFAAMAAALRAKAEAREELPPREALRASVQASTRQAVEKRLVEYLQTNQNHLFMYLVPSAAVMRKMEDRDLIHGRRQ